MIIPDEIREQISTHFSKEAYEILIRDCAAVCAEMYKTPPADFNHFDLAQGWEAALDLAEQAILKRYGLTEEGK